MDLEEPSSSKGDVKRESIVSNTGVTFGGRSRTNIQGSLKVSITHNSHQPQKKRRIEFNIQDPIESFTGREHILETLHTTIQKSKSTERVTVLSKAKVVTGMGGLGKTETIRKYAFEYKRFYGHTLWINAETYLQAKDCFKEIAFLCNVPSDNFDSRKAVILDQIYDYLCEEPCLLVFDNAESMGTANSKEGIRPFLPMTVKTGWVPPAIVATSRNRVWGQAALIELPGLSENECFALLTIQLELSDTQENRECARRITEMCEGLPLVVQQVVAIIRDTNKERETLALPKFTMQNFLSDFHDGGQDFIDTMPADSPVGSTAFQIFKIAFDRILMKEIGETAFRCLRVMALLNPDNIPAKLLMSLIAPMTQDMTVLTRALNMLRNQNLVTLHDGIYKIHRVIQLVAMLYNPNECQTTAPGSLVSKVDELGNAIRGTAELCCTTVDILASIIPHFVDVLVQIQLNDKNFNDILQNGVKIASHLKKRSEVEGIISFLEALAKKLKAAGKFSEAENVWEDLLVIYTNGKENSTEKLCVKCQLAWACSEQGKYDEALKIYKQVLETRESELETDHEDILSTKGSMAVVYTRQQKYDVAIELHEYVLRIQEIKFGSNDPRTIATKNNLAGALDEVGKYERAMELYHDAVKYQELQLGPNHRETLATKYNLALLLQQMGKYDEAAKMLEDTLKGEESELGRDHIDTLETKSSLAKVLQVKGEYQRAFQLHEETLKAKVTQLGLDDKSTIMTKRNFACLHIEMGKCDTAVEMLEDVLKGLQNIRNPDHALTIYLKEALAYAYYNKGEHERASQLYEEVLKFQDSLFGPNSLETLLTKYRLAFSFKAIGKYGAAIGIYQQILEYQEKTVGPDHPETMCTKDFLGGAFYAKGEYERASELYEEVLKFEDSYYESNSSVTLDTKTCLAKSFTRMRNYGAAMEIYEQILEHEEKHLGPNHPDTLATKHIMAWNLRKQGRYDEALRLCEDIQNNLKQAPDVIYPEIMGIKDEIARIYAYQGKYEDATELFEEVLENYTKTLGPNHPVTKNGEQRLRVALEGKANSTERQCRNVSSSGNHHFSLIIAILCAGAAIACTLVWKIVPNFM